MTFTVRKALRQLLVSEWNPNNTLGYDPTAERAADEHLKIHLGEYDDDFGPPQVSLTDVSSSAQGDSGYYAMKADGTGFAQRYDGRVDARTFGGSHGEIHPDGEELASALGREVRDIIHSNAIGVTDGDGEKVAEDIGALSEPVTLPDTDFSPSRWYCRVELGYRRTVDPPQR